MNKFLYIILAAVIAVAGCKKNDLGEAPRLFRPVIAGSLLADSNTIVAGWQKIGGATSYTLQVSRDTFKTIDRTINTDSSGAIIKGLLFNTLYQLQLRAVANDTIKNSAWSYLGAIKTQTSILQIPGVSDITTNSVRARWTTKGAPVTEIRIKKASDNSVVATVALTAIDRTNEFKIVTGLTPGTAYIMELYSGTDLRGYVDFQTKAPFAGNVIDLTGITGRPSVLTDTIPIVASGSTIVLKRGEQYNISTSLALNKSLNIVAGQDLAVPARPILYFTNNFNFAAGATIDSLVFNDLYMYSDNWTSRYVFNTTASATIGSIKFLNSKLEIFRGLLRLQSGTGIVNNYVINNCLVDSIQGYGLAAIAATCRIDNIALTNSSIYKCDRLLNSSSNSVSLLIDQCTFNEAAQGNGSIMFDWGSLNVTSGVTITSSIFGIGHLSSGTYQVKGARFGSSTNVNTSNNYRTSDQVSTGNDIPNIITYTRPSTQLWADPFNGNFTIADALYPGKSNTGDPRWR